MWLDQVHQAQGRQDQIEVNWKPFSLEQVNQKVGPEHKVWDLPEEEHHPSLWGLRAGVAARRQGDEGFGRFLPTLLKARHEERKELDDIDMLKGLAAEAGLNVERFERDLRDRSSLDEVATSHEEARERHGVFGTPTFVFSNGAAAFVKLIKPRSHEEAAKAFDSVVALLESEVFIGEIKRPQPPWPKGIFD